MYRLSQSLSHRPRIFKRVTQWTCITKVCTWSTSASYDLLRAYWNLRLSPSLKRLCAVPLIVDERVLKEWCLQLIESFRYFTETETPKSAEYALRGWQPSEWRSLIEGKYSSMRMKVPPIFSLEVTCRVSFVLARKPFE